MSSSDPPPNSNHSSPSNTIVHQDVIHNPNNRDNTAIVSPPQNAIRPTNDNTIITENASIVSTKNILRSDLISSDPAKHLSVGHKVILDFLRIVDRKGFDDCMGYAKKKPFIEKINEQLHADDGPLRSFKKTSDDTFLKKITRALKVLDGHLDISHSSGPGADGEEYPAHLRQLLVFYKKILKTSLAGSAKEKSQSEKNLVVQNEIMNNIIPPVHGSNMPRHSSRARNLKEGHTLVVRGDNTHHASNREIITINDKPIFKKKSTPNTSALLQNAQTAKRDFSAMFEQMNSNQVRKEEIISKENKTKLDLYRSRTEMKREVQQKRIEIFSEHWKQKTNERRILI